MYDQTKLQQTLSLRAFSFASCSCTLIHSLELYSYIDEYCCALYLKYE